MKGFGCHSMKGYFQNILQLIGNTPLVELRRVNPYKRVRIMVKLESFNPGGSIKDRIALNMIEAAERRGELTKDKIVLEASSGNTGIGLALVCAVKGYRCLIAMSEGASLERRKIMKAFGAEILLTPARLGTDGAIEAVYKLFRENPKKYFLTDQFNNPDNWKTHYNTTAPEIWEQTGGELDAVVATMGTTGTLMGLARKFKEMAPNVAVIGVEPYLGHAIQGLKNMKESYKPGIFDKKVPDKIIHCHDDEAFEMARRLAREEGIFVGMSSGAAVSAAIEVASHMDSGTVVAILPDGGERYLSTELFAYEEGEKEESKTLRLFNTKGHKKGIFEPLRPRKAGIYSCGPTACEYIDLSMARRVVTADLLRRTLDYIGYEVTHVMNITDIDDRTINAAFKKGMDLKGLTQKYANAFFEDIARLNVKEAAHYPLASEHIEDMVETTSQLMEKGYAYQRHGSVYFDVSKLHGYGALSGVKLDAIDIGRTVDLDEYEKDSPLDFTLFKRISLQELKIGIGYETPWGMARPGWHIECAAMSRKYLGDYFDIHTCGTNLLFPHHENEVAIARALTGKGLARFWLHSEMVLFKGKKMSSNHEDRVTLRELFEKGFSGRSIRFYLLRSHYRKAINFTMKSLQESCKALARIDTFKEDLKSCLLLDPEREPSDNIIQETELLCSRFLTAILDDLNTSGAMGALFSFIKKINPLITTGQISGQESSLILEKLQEVDTILGLLDVKTTKAQVPERVLTLLKEREAAREQRDFKRSDELRKELIELGFEVIDTKNGPRIRHIRSAPCQAGGNA